MSTNNLFFVAQLSKEDFEHCEHISQSALHATPHYDCVLKVVEEYSQKYNVCKYNTAVIYTELKKAMEKDKKNVGKNACVMRISI
jgi:hypothetical protein